MSFLPFTRDSKGDAGVLKTLNTVNNLVRTILSLAILAAIGTGGWLAYQHFFAEKWRAQRELQAQEARIAGLSKDVERKDLQIDRLTGELLSSHEQIDRLEIDVQAKQREIERLDTALRLMKVDHRVAQIDVLAQEGSQENGDLITHFSFVELDKEGNSLEDPRLFSVKGDVVYLDSLVVKFSDEYVELGDPLRSTSLCFFRRVFGETQKPSEGYVLDEVGSQPTAYRTGGKTSDVEREIWGKFWEYASDPVKAQDAGVRAAHGEAPFQKLIPGKRYKVLLRASGGLTFPPPEDLPPEARPGPPTETL